MSQQYSVTRENGIFTVLKKGKIYGRYTASSFVFGCMGYDEKAYRLPLYIHDEVWRLDRAARRVSKETQKSTIS